MRKNNTNKRERYNLQRQKISASLCGEGLFLFKNKTNASLQLPKKSSDGKVWVEPNQTWKGDSFFLKMIPKEAVLIETIESPNKKEESNMSEEKLLLDQPDQITPEGKLEHVVSNEPEALNEETTKRKRKTKSESKKEEKKLLTEDPIAGVTIIRD
jgi:hypothetical protein